MESDFVTITMLQAWRTELEESFKKGVKSQEVKLKGMEEKCSELTKKDVESLRKELHEERGNRRATVVTLMETIGKLHEGVEELKAKTALLEARMEEMGAGHDSPQLNLENEGEGGGGEEMEDYFMASPPIKIERVEGSSMEVEDQNIDTNPSMQAVLHAILPTTQSGHSQDYEYSHHLYLVDEVDEVPENESGSQASHWQLTPIKDTIPKKIQRRKPSSKRLTGFRSKSGNAKKKLEASRISKNRSKDTQSLKTSRSKKGKSTENSETSNEFTKEQSLIRSPKAVQPRSKRLPRSKLSDKRDETGMSISLPVLSILPTRKRKSKAISRDKNRLTANTTPPIAVNVGASSQVLDVSVGQNLAVTATKETVSEPVTPAVQEDNATSTSKQPTEINISATSSNGQDSNNMDLKLVREHSQKASASTPRKKPPRSRGADFEISSQSFLESSEKRKRTSSLLLQSMISDESFRFGSRKQIITPELSSICQFSFRSTKSRSQCPELESVASVGSLKHEFMQRIISSEESATKIGKSIGPAFSSDSTRTVKVDGGADASVEATRNSC